MDNERSSLLQSLATIIADYRRNEITPISPEHVERWLAQFDKDDQQTILTEMNSIMSKFYFSRVRMKKCLHKFLQTGIIATNNPSTVLPHVSFIQNQQKGSSQKFMLNLINEILHEEYDYSLAQCGTSNIELYVYVDDSIYTGNRLRYDLTKGENAPTWITNYAPRNCTLLIYATSIHKDGYSYVERLVKQEAEVKGIRVRWGYSLLIDNKRLLENGQISDNRIEVLWPETPLYDSQIDSYVSRLRTYLEHQNWPTHNLFRSNGLSSQETLFSSLEARRTVERAFLRKGVDIITACRDIAPSMRPLGFIKISSLGFGTFFVTYRNIANNCPLVFWWGTRNWYPLFPRKTNEWDRYNV